MTTAQQCPGIELAVGRHRSDPRGVGHLAADWLSCPSRQPATCAPLDQQAELDGPGLHALRGLPPGMRITPPRIGFSRSGGWYPVDPRVQSPQRHIGPPSESRVRLETSSQKRSGGFPFQLAADPSYLPFHGLFLYILVSLQFLTPPCFAASASESQLPITKPGITNWKSRYSSTPSCQQTPTAGGAIRVTSWGMGTTILRPSHRA